jgi:DNA-directed RNA polymerase subunit RPC12/RpoP
MAIYECKACSMEEFVPRRFRLHFGGKVRCPKCGTFRVVRLKAPDHIDPMYSGFLNLLEKLSGGRLHHCRYCRIQFYDRRSLATDAADDRTEPETAAPNGARSDA